MWGRRNDCSGLCTPPGHNFFFSWGRQSFLQSNSQSAGVLLCPPVHHVALLTAVAGICMNRPDYTPATSLEIHSLVGLGMSLEPGFLKLYFNGLTLVNPSERGYERELVLISIY